MGREHCQETVLLFSPTTQRVLVKLEGKLSASYFTFLQLAALAACKTQPSCAAFKDQNGVKAIGKAAK